MTAAVKVAALANFLARGGKISFLEMFLTDKMSCIVVSDAVVDVVHVVWKLLVVCAVVVELDWWRSAVCPLPLAAPRGDLILSLKALKAAQRLATALPPPSTPRSPDPRSPGSAHFPPEVAPILLEACSSLWPWLWLLGPPEGSLSPEVQRTESVRHSWLFSMG
jgi:hypothetical protein